MEESRMMLHISFREFIEWLNEIYFPKPEVDPCVLPPKITNAWGGQHAQKYAQKFFPAQKPQQTLQPQSEPLGVVKASVQSIAQTAVELTAQHAGFAKLAAFFIVIGNALAQAAKAIHEHAKESSALYNASAQVYAKDGFRMG